MEIWEGKKIELSSHCNREGRESLFTRSQGFKIDKLIKKKIEYRVKIEKAKAVEATKSD